MHNIGCNIVAILLYGKLHDFVACMTLPLACMVYFILYSFSRKTSSFTDLSLELPAQV